MAHFTISNGIDGITGALKKTTHQGVNHISVTRRKEHHDPITGEVVGYGPNEMYIKDKRDYNEHPLTPGEKRQRGNWSQACREALVIYRDKSIPASWNSTNDGEHNSLTPIITKSSFPSSVPFSATNSKKALRRFF